MVLLGMRAAFGNSIFPDKPCLEICKQQYQSYKNNYCPIFCFKIFVHFFLEISLTKYSGCTAWRSGTRQTEGFWGSTTGQLSIGWSYWVFFTDPSPIFVFIWKVQFHFLCEIKKSRYFPITFKKQFTKKCQLSEWVSLEFLN